MKRLATLRLSVRHLFLLVPFAGLAWATTRPFRDNSFLWHVRAGTLQLDLGEVLTTDPFSLEYLGESWRTQSWLADILYGWLETSTGGLGWVRFYIFLVLAAALVFTLIAVWKSTEHLAVTAAAGVLLVWQAVPFTAGRPVVFSYLLLAATALAVTSKRTLWAVPAIIWVWAALHGSFVLGLGLVVLYGLARRSRAHFELAAVGALLATLTAHGVGVWQVLAEFASNRGALDLIQEWQPPDYTNPFMFPYALLLLVLVAGGAFGGIARRDLWVVLPFALFGMTAVRNLLPAMIVILPYAAAAVTPSRVEARKVDSPAIVLGLAALIVLVGAIGLARPLRLAESTFPGAAALDALEPGPVFHGIAVGGYLIYSQWPERPILVDDRAELYGVEGFERYIEVAEGTGWEELFENLDIDQALLDVEWGLGRELLRAGWTETHRDEHFVVARAP